MHIAAVHVASQECLACFELVDVAFHIALLFHDKLKLLLFALQVLLGKVDLVVHEAEALFGHAAFVLDLLQLYLETRHLCRFLANHQRFVVYFVLKLGELLKC